MLPFLTTLLIVTLFWFPVQAQTNSTSKPSQTVFNVVEEPPQFPGGMSKFDEYVKKNLRYPKVARKAKLEGRVVVNFVVTDTGHIENVKLFNSLGLGTDEEAIRLVKDMPEWSPGRKEGKPVNVNYNVPITFSLD